MDFALAGGQASLSAVLSENTAMRAQVAARGLDSVVGGAAAGPQSDAALRQAAQAFEQVFVAQMLQHAGIAEMKGPFSGGYGEDAFRSFLIDEYAAALSQNTNFGLADQIYAQLKERVAP
ncbi:MAG: rod-binding protein [Pseudomonadota bacterium]